VRAYLELLRPPNVVTAIADVLAGYAVAGRGRPEALPWLIAASVCLYAGGVVLNDFFDRNLDRYPVAAFHRHARQRSAAGFWLRACWPRSVPHE
jgi:4-hydroxybenzoate polyprenyltransferase